MLSILFRAAAPSHSHRHGGGEPPTARKRPAADEILFSLDSLEVLSIGRNQIKKLEGLEDVSATLRELWMSYNLIEKLNGIEKVWLLTICNCFHGLITGC